MAQLNEFVTKNKEKVTVLLFWAKWYLESAKLKEKMEEMQTNMAHVLFVWCDVDVDKEMVRKRAIIEAALAKAKARQKS